MMCYLYHLRSISTVAHIEVYPYTKSLHGSLCNQKKSTFIKSIFYKSIIPLFIMKFYLNIHSVNFLYQIWPILHYYNFNYNTINHRVVNNKKTSPQVHVLGYYFSLIYNQTNINLSYTLFLWETHFFKAYIADIICYIFCIRLYTFLHGYIYHKSSSCHLNYMLCEITDIIFMDIKIYLCLIIYLVLVH